MFVFVLDAGLYCSLLANARLRASSALIVSKSIETFSSVAEASAEQDGDCKNGLVCIQCGAKLKDNPS